MYDASATRRHTTRSSRTASPRLEAHPGRPRRPLHQPPVALAMQVAIRSRGVDLSDALREHVVRRFSFALSRASLAVRRIDVTLADINGPKGGVDKVCRVRARGPGLREIVIEERHSDLAVAIDLASSRAGRTVMRAIDLRRRTPRALVPA